ncbi:MAG: Bax inhibitor-1/YccA family protein [Cytophagales bacterium]|nr:Bax inhibitor-1/YccA family protein [Cytophagales bacterium]
MAITRTSNPVFSRMSNGGIPGIKLSSTSKMTIQGTAFKTLILLFIASFAALYTYAQTFQAAESINAFIFGGAIAGFIIALITVFTPKWSPFTAPIYALCEGLFLGGISAMFEAQFPGIVISAVMGTFGVMLSLLFLYASRIIRVTSKLRMGILAATGGVFFVILIGWILSLFHVNIPFLFGGGTSALIFTGIVAVIAALNLLLDFDMIEQGYSYGFPKYMEWYCAFGLLVTLIWLYLEILRFLALLRNRD